jgi:hypothetical protein
MIVPAPRQVLLGAMICSSLALASCRVEAPAANEAAPQPANVAAAEPARPAIAAPEPRLDREALLIAALRARSAAASGTDDVARQAELDGKRFTFRIRLGCSFSPDKSPGGAAARYDAGERRVELEATPDVSLDQPAVAAIAGEAAEAVEGFWISQPWLLEPSCAGSDAAQPLPSEPAAVALAQFYTAADARTERREGRSYQARQSLAADAEAPAPGSWDLVLRGRLRKAEGGRVILCRSVEPQALPTCIISVSFEEVLIENVGTGEVLARWGRG